MSINHDLQFVIETIRAGNCVPFLGAGASTAYLDHEGCTVPGIPVGGQLAENIAKACEYSNGATYDLSKVAEYFVYKQSGHRGALAGLIRAAVSQASGPRPIHTVLAQLSEIQYILTTNYDRLLEDELERVQRRFKLHVHDQEKANTAKFSVKPSELKADRTVVLHKMHGTIEPGLEHTMVITQTDYIRYLVCLNDSNRGMPAVFRQEVIPQKTLLFLGYSLEDWNFRVIWEGVLSTNQGFQRNIKSYAIVKSSTDFQKDYWRDRNIKIIDHDLTEFAKVLADEFGLEIPQLGIRKPDAVPQEGAAS